MAILLAQHFNEGMLNSLPRILNRHNTWRCDVIYSTRPLITGRCLIAPVQQSIVCDSTGRVIFSCRMGGQAAISLVLASYYQTAVRYLVITGAYYLLRYG